MTSKIYETEEYYMQDTRSYVGNCMMWWAKAGGYTSDILKAKVWGYKEAVLQTQCRDTDKRWPKRYIDARTQVTVDMQYVNEKDANHYMKVLTQS